LVGSREIIIFALINYLQNIKAMTPEQIQHIQKILDLRADIAKLSVELNTIGKEYTAKYCPFKPKDKVLIDGSPAEVYSVGFDPDSYIEGRAKIQVKYFESDWSGPKTTGILIETITDSKRIKNYLSKDFYNLVFQYRAG